MSVMAIRYSFNLRGAGSFASARLQADIVKKFPNQLFRASSGFPRALEADSKARLGPSDSWVLDKFRGAGDGGTASFGGNSSRLLQSKRGNSGLLESAACRLIPRAAMASTAGEKKRFKIIGISGSLRKASTNSGLLRAAATIAEEKFSDVDIEILEVGHLPFINTDLEVKGTYPEAVADFRAKILGADGFLFASPEYNYSVSPVLKNAIDWASRPPNVWADKGAAIVCAGGGAGGARSAYHIRQSGVFVDLHFINKPEFFVKIFEPPSKFDSNGDLTDAKTKEILEGVVKSLRDWVIRMK